LRSENLKIYLHAFSRMLLPVLFLKYISVNKEALVRVEI